jgi:ABC-type iron transport system FetAB ATPase subunit
VPQSAPPRADAPVILSVRELRSRFGGPFTFDVRAGECIAIQGPSGAGKSVLLRMLADLDPHDGAALLDGRPSASMPAPAWRAAVVYQPAEPAWWEDTARAHFSGVDPGVVEDKVAALGLAASVLDTAIDRLSTGERQRLALVRSLSRRPRVLLLDEPTASLDPASVGRAEALLAGCLAEGMAVLIVTHAAEQARRVAHRIFHLERGMLTTP